MKVVLVALLGAAGAVSRYGVGTAVGTTTFPWATLGINIAGCLVLGVVLAVGPVKWSPELTTGIGVGFLGGFTTFSAFGVETQTMLRDDRLGAAVAYVGLSVVFGVLAAYVGTTLGRSLVD